MIIFPEKYRINSKLFLLLIIVISSVALVNIKFSSSSHQKISEREITKTESENQQLEEGDYNPKFSLQSFSTPNILFIVGDAGNLDNIADQPFFNYMTNNLSFNVILHSDDNSYDLTNIDAVVISQSIIEVGAVTTLNNSHIPILTMERYNQLEFNLSLNSGNDKNKLNIIPNNLSHYILENSIPDQIVQIYDVAGELHYLRDFGLLHEIDLIISPELQASSRKVLVALDKDKND